MNRTIHVNIMTILSIRNYACVTFTADDHHIRSSLEKVSFRGFYITFTWKHIKIVCQKHKNRPLHFNYVCDQFYYEILMGKCPFSCFR